MQLNDKQVRFRVFISPPKPYKSQDRWLLPMEEKPHCQSGLRFHRRNFMAAAPKCSRQFNKETYRNNLLPPFRKKVGLPYIPFCFKWAVFHAFQYKISFLWNFMHYNCLFNIIFIKTSILGEKKTISKQTQKNLFKIGQK
jgi:hypothetical protein